MDPQNRRVDDRQLAVFVHLLAFLGLLIPFTNILGPLILWQYKRRGSMLVDEHGKESVNFQISITIYTLGSIALAFVGVGIPIGVALLIFGVICVVIAAVKAYQGELFRYPLSIRFIR